MPVLTNARHERFAQNIAKGMSATEAYVEAGYKPSRPHAARLATKGNVRDRIADLQGSTAKQITDIRDLSRQYTIEAVELQAEIMRDAGAPPSVRLAASLALHDRGHGKAVQHIEAEIGVYDSLSLDQKQTLLAALGSIPGDEEGASGGPSETHR